LKPTGRAPVAAHSIDAEQRDTSFGLVLPDRASLTTIASGILFKSTDFAIRTDTLPFRVLVFSRNTVDACNGILCGLYQSCFTFFAKCTRIGISKFAGDAPRARLLRGASNCVSQGTNPALQLFDQIIPPSCRAISAIVLCFL
jgi:hypothetical protein